MCGLCPLEILLNEILPCHDSDKVILIPNSSETLSGKKQNKNKSPSFIFHPIPTSQNHMIFFLFSPAISSDLNTGYFTLVGKFNLYIYLWSLPFLTCELVGIQLFINWLELIAPKCNLFFKWDFLKIFLISTLYSSCTWFSLFKLKPKMCKTPEPLLVDVTETDFISSL